MQETPFTRLMALKITPSAKVVALHFAATLQPDTETPSHPRHVADALGISRGEYERAWRECARQGWVVGRSPCVLLMRADALPRAALMCQIPSKPSAMKTDARPAMSPKVSK